jgi:putative SOS response-associated peptidase YedK
MPLTIAPDDVPVWLSPTHTDPAELHHLLRRPADGALRVRAVPPTVNSVRAPNGPQLLDIAPDPLGLAD